MPTPYYSRSETDTKLAALRHEWRADLKDAELALRGEIGLLRTETAEMEGRLHTELARMRGEWKTWMLLLGAVLTVVSSGLGSRALNLLLPPVPGTAPAAGIAPFGR